MAEANPQSLPTRTPPITDLENILRNCIYTTLQPKVEPSEVSTYIDIDIYLIERMFFTEESYLEGILRNTSDPDYAQFLLVFRDTFNEERHAKRLQICASQLSVEWSPGSEIIYVGRSSGLKDYEVTNTAFFEVIKSNLIECQYSYSDIIKGSSKIAVAIRNVTDRTITLPKGTRVGEIYTANKIPKILN